MRQELTATSDYRMILREELAARCRQNPRYSLRAFARDLKLAPSRLSEILNGKQGMSREVAHRVAITLGYAVSEADRFCDLVEAMHARSRVGRETAKVRLKKHELPSEKFQLQLDAFKAIADWYHFGILELTNVTGFKSDAKWIGKKLGISEFEAQLAIERLARLGLVQWKGDKLRLTHEQGHVPDDIPSDSIKKFHSQILLKAKDALYMQSVEEREFGSEILSIDRSMLPEAKKAIREFSHKFCKKMGEAETKDGLYCLAVQFFDLGEKGVTT
jgi:uncharacterized protein (TIGR02147 family)